MKRLFLPLIFFAAAGLPGKAAVIQFDLFGTGGAGLSPSSETFAVTGNPGFGNEFGAGISFDDVSKILVLNIAWGSANGFADLTGNATAAHLHGPTASGGTASFTQNAGPLFTLSGTAEPTWNASASAGGITGRELALTAAQEADLMDGKYYVNVHTSTNSGGASP